MEVRITAVMKCMHGGAHYSCGVVHSWRCALQLWCGAFMEVRITAVVWCMHGGAHYSSDVVHAWRYALQL